MDLRQLEYLLAVADEANFTRAAAALHVAQPGVSAQIRRLERELGFELLDRSTRSVRLTDVGAAVAPHARAALAAIDAIRETVDELAGLVRGQVAVGMVPGCGSLDVPDLLEGFHGAHPGVVITLTEGNANHLLDAVREGSLDMAFVGLAGDDPEGVETIVVVEDAIALGVREDHPLAHAETVMLRSLREVPLISLPVGTGMRTALDRACAAAGFQPRVALEASDPALLIQLARRGLGAAVLPAAAAAEPPLRAVAIKPEMHGRVALAWRNGGPSGPAARALMVHAQATLGSAVSSRRAV